MSHLWIFGSVILVVLILGIGIVLWTRGPTLSTTLSTSPTTTGTQTSDSSSPLIRAQDIPGAASQFTFAAEMPQRWQAEAIAGIEAISLYDPTLPGNDNLEKSQIFIRHFTANDFLTLASVTIHARTPRTIAGRPAVRYDITKKPSVANFPNQPLWRNQRHIVTDIRVSDSNPSVFYVIAKRPNLAPGIYEHFLNTLTVNGAATSLIEPVAEFTPRITKKPFGLFITPDSSPIQPERFTGYHTGVDVEYGDVAGEVLVRAITPGVVRLSQTVSGYGGVLAVEHEINQAKNVAIYGHLKPSSLAPKGQAVAAGETIGMLGDGGTAATDFERKHLHFAVLNSTTVDLRGYVPTKDELALWRNPQELF